MKKRIFTLAAIAAVYAVLLYGLRFLPAGSHAQTIGLILGFLAALVGAMVCFPVPVINDEGERMTDEQVAAAIARFEKENPGPKQNILRRTLLEIGV